MARQTRGINVYIVSRPDTHSGMSIRADDPTDAIYRALRMFSRTFRGALEVRAVFFAGPTDREETWSSARMRITG
jgi:hypothetical protein